MGKGEKLPIEEIFEENENYEISMNETLDFQNKKSAVSRVFLPINEKKSERNKLVLKKIVSKQAVKSPIEIESPKLLKIASNSSQMSRNKHRTQTLNDKHKKELIWNYKDHLKKDPPCLDVEIIANEFSLNSLQFCIWGTNNPEEHSNNYSEEESIKKDEADEVIMRNKSFVIHFVDLRMIGECYWSFNKLFREDFHAVNFLFICFF